MTVQELERNYRESNNTIKNWFSPNKLLKNELYIIEVDFLYDINIDFNSSIEKLLLQGKIVQKNQTVLIKNQTSEITLSNTVNPDDFFEVNYTIINQGTTTTTYSFFNENNGIYIYDGEFLTKKEFDYKNTVFFVKSIQQTFVTSSRKNFFDSIDGEELEFREDNIDILRNSFEYQNLFDKQINGCVLYNSDIIFFGEFGLIMIYKNNQLIIINNPYKFDILDAKVRQDEVIFVGKSANGLRLNLINFDFIPFKIGEYLDVNTIEISGGKFFFGCEFGTVFTSNDLSNFKEIKLSDQDINKIAFPSQTSGYVLLNRGEVFNRNLNKIDLNTNRNITDVKFNVELTHRYLNFPQSNLTLRNTLTKQTEFSFDIFFRIESFSSVQTLFEVGGLVITIQEISGNIKLVTTIHGQSFISDRNIPIGEFICFGLSRLSNEYKTVFNGRIDSNFNASSNMFISNDISVGSSFEGQIAHIRFFNSFLTAANHLDNFRNYSTDINDLINWYDFSAINRFDKKNNEFAQILNEDFFEQTNRFDLFVAEESIIFKSDELFEFKLNDKVHSLEFIDDNILLLGESVFIMDKNQFIIDKLNTNTPNLEYFTLIEDSYNKINTKSDDVLLVGSSENRIDYFNKSELCINPLTFDGGVLLNDINFLNSTNQTIISRNITISPLTEIYVKFRVEKLYNGTLQIQSANEWLDITTPGEYSKKISMGPNNRIRFRVIDPKIGTTITSTITNIEVFESFQNQSICFVNLNNINFSLYNTYENKLLFLDYDIANKLYFFNNDEYQLPKEKTLHLPTNILFEESGNDWLRLDRDIKRQGQELYNTEFEFNSDKLINIENFSVEGQYLFLPDSEVSLNLGDVISIKTDFIEHICFVEDIQNNEYIIRTYFNKTINNLLIQKGEFQLELLKYFSSYSDLIKTFEKHFLGSGYKLEKDILVDWLYNLNDILIDIKQSNDGIFLLTSTSIRRINFDGTIDTRFNEFSGTLNILETQGSGKVIINDQGVLKRLNRDGSMDITYPTIPNTINDVLSLNNDRIIVATDNSLLKFRSNGQVDNNFNSPSGNFLSLSLTPGGNIAAITNSDAYILGQTGTVLNTFSVSNAQKIIVHKTRLYILRNNALSSYNFNGSGVFNYSISDVNDFDVSDRGILYATDSGTFFTDLNGLPTTDNNLPEQNFVKFLDIGFFTSTERYYDNKEKYKGDIDIIIKAKVNNRTLYKNMQYKVNGDLVEYPTKFLDFKYTPFYNIQDILNLPNNFYLKNLRSFTFPNNNQHVIYNLQEGFLSFNPILQPQYDSLHVGTFVDLKFESGQLITSLLYRKQTDENGRLILYLHTFNNVSNVSGEVTITTRNNIGQIAQDLNLLNSLSDDFIKYKPNHQAYLNALISEKEILDDITGIVYRDEFNNLCVNFINLPIRNNKKITSIDFYDVLSDNCQYNEYQLFSGKNQIFIINDNQDVTNVSNINNQILITSNTNSGTLEVDLSYDNIANKILSFDVDMLIDVDAKIQIDGVLLANIPNNINKSYNITFDSNLSDLKFIFDYTEDSLVDIKNIRIGNVDCKFTNRKIKINLDNTDGLDNHIFLNIENNVSKEEVIFSSDYSWNELNDSTDLFSRDNEVYLFDGMTGTSASSIELTGGIIDEEFTVGQNDEFKWEISTLSLSANPHRLFIRYKSNNTVNINLDSGVNLNSLSDTSGEYMDYLSTFVAPTTTEKIIFEFLEGSYEIEILEIRLEELVNVGKVYDGLHTINNIEGNTIFLDTDYLGGFFEQIELQTTITPCGGLEKQVEVPIPIDGVGYIWEFDPMLKYQPIDILPLNADKTINNSIKIEKSNYVFDKDIISIEGLDRDKFRIKTTDGTSINFIDENYSWLLEAELDNAVIGFDGDDIIFYSGLFECGRWFSGKFFSGVFKEGQFYDGEFLNKKVEQSGTDFIVTSSDSKTPYSKWLSGDFRGGLFRGGLFRSGDFYNGEFKNSKILNATFHTGIIEQSEFLGGVFIDGNAKDTNFVPSFSDIIILDGSFDNTGVNAHIFYGEFNNSVIEDSLVENFSIRNSTIQNSVIKIGKSNRNNFISNTIYLLDDNNSFYQDNTLNGVDMVGYVVDDFNRNYLITLKGDFNFRINDNITIQGREDLLFGSTVRDNINIPELSSPLLQFPRNYSIVDFPVKIEKDEILTRIRLSGLPNYFVVAILNNPFFAKGYENNDFPSDNTITLDKLNDVVSTIQSPTINNSLVNNGYFSNATVNQITVLDGHFNSGVLSYSVL